MRAVVDDDVDRHDVEAQQCVELTCTNRSIGLIALITQCPSAIGGSRYTERPAIAPDEPTLTSFTNNACFAGLVAFARSPHPIPFRTRPLNSSAPMVLWLKPRESRSPPGLPSTRSPFSLHPPNIPRPKSPPNPPTLGPKAACRAGYPRSSATQPLPRTPGGRGMEERQNISDET